MSFQELPFLDVFRDASGGNIKTPQKDFLEEGEIPVVDQGQGLVAGFVNDRSRVCTARPPVIVFGDHTRTIKYVDFEFAMGADGTKVLVPRIESDTKYLYYALSSIEIPAAGYSRHYKFLKKTQLPIPPLAEQKRIAGILDAADALRAKRRESLAQLDTLLQSTFLDMFGDPVTNPMGWEVKPLSTFIETITDYRGKTPPKSEQGIPLLSAANVKQGKIDLSHKQFITPEVYAEWTTRGFTQPGDVLITTEAPVGEVAPYPKHGTFQISRRVMALRPNKHLLPEVLLHVMLAPSWHKRLCRLTRGSTVPRVLKPSITGQLVPVLPGDRQRRFADMAKFVEREEALSNAHLDKLDTLFASLQSRAFRGDL